MKKILIVEDEQDMTQLVEKKLRNSGFEVISAASGKEAVLKFQEQRPDLVLMDVVLPDCDGFEICRRIKREFNSDVKILVYTGKLAAVDARTARTSGADELVVKTDDLKTVVDTIRQLLSD